MSLDDLCGGLLARYDGQPAEGTDQPNEAEKEEVRGGGGGWRRVTPASAEKLRKRK